MNHRNRILSAALVATVLAVGTTLAFREKVVTKGQTGFGHVARSSQADDGKERNTRIERRQEESGSDLLEKPDPDWSVAIEDFLMAKGRSAPNLCSAYRITHNTLYLEEIRGLRNDPVAQAIVTREDERENADAAAARLLEIDPQNAYADVNFLCKQWCRESDEQVFLRRMEAAAAKPAFRTYEGECDRAELAAWQMLLGDARGAWGRSFGLPLYEEGKRRTESFNITWFGYITLALEKESDPVRRMEIASNVHALADLARGTEGMGKEVGEFERSMMEKMRPEERMEVFGVTLEEHKARDAEAVAASEQRESAYWPAYLVATNQEIEAMAAVYREKGMIAAKQSLVARISPAEIERRKREKE